MASCRSFAHMPADGSLPACVVPLAELSRRLKASKHPSVQPVAV